MSRLVIDASITLSWLLPDEADNDTLSVRNEMLTAESVWVPAHWKLEVANSLWMAERRKRLDSAGLAQAVSLFLQLPVTIDPDTNARAGSETLAFARHHGISVYDAAYLELASRRGSVLCSLDGPLRSVAEKGVTVLPAQIM
jgi:predicted nucleic acid-binding protein